MKKRPPYNSNAAFRGALRRAFARSPKVLEVLHASRREVPWKLKDGSIAKRPRVQRQCQVCDQWVGSTNIAVDHVEPVVSVDHGFKDWNEFVGRLDCDKGNLQRICSACHGLKTNSERFTRMFKLECSQLSAVEPVNARLEDIKAFVKKFTKKRLGRYPYPQEFKDRITILKRRCGMRV